MFWFFDFPPDCSLAKKEIIEYGYITMNSWITWEWFIRLGFLQVDQQSQVECQSRRGARSWKATKNKSIFQTPLEYFENDHRKSYEKTGESGTCTLWRELDCLNDEVELQRLAAVDLWAQFPSLIQMTDHQRRKFIIIIIFSIMVISHDFCLSKKWKRKRKWN